MKFPFFTILTAAAAAVPTTTSPASTPIPATPAPKCTINLGGPKTTPTSPLVADCQALSAFVSRAFVPWSPSSKNNYTFDIHSETCGFHAAYQLPTPEEDPDDDISGGSSVIPSDEELAKTVVVSDVFITNTLDNLIDLGAVDGRVGGRGLFACEIAEGYNVTNWLVTWEIYNTVDGRTAS